MANSQVFDALEFAVQAHRGQFRKGTSIPYVVHPIGVGRILIEAGCAEHVVIAGILHDTMEDAGVSDNDLRSTFGDSVAELVSAVSEIDKSEPWEERKRKTLEALESASEDILVLALADKLDNIRSIRDSLRFDGDEVWLRFRRPKDDQAWYYKSLVALFEGRISRKPGRELFPEFQVLVQKVFEE
ncbi:MAG: HD domain-containing protein [Anaerolineales bacterium]|nr:HD domain-containing protein [Anaerolineales bacterium]